MFLLGSITLRLMAMVFLFPVVARLTLSAVRPGYLSNFVERADFPYQVGFDVIFAIIGVSLLFHETAGKFLSGSDTFALSLVRAIVVSAMTGLAILRALHMSVALEVIPDVQGSGIMQLAIGFWTLFFALCVFPGWYGRRLRQHAGPPLQAPTAWPSPAGARYLTLPTGVPAPTRPRRTRRARAPDMRHMTLADWLSTLVAFALLASLAAGAIYGVSDAKFLPTATHEAQVARAVWPLGVICAVLLIALVLRGPRPRRISAFGSPFWRTVGAAAIFYFGFYISAEPALQVGLPDAWARSQGGSESTVNATVVARDQNYRRHKCNNTALVVMDIGEGARNYIICDVPPSIWSSLERGNRLQVSGIVTPFGFSYRKVAAL